MSARTTAAAHDPGVAPPRPAPLPPPDSVAALRAVEVSKRYGDTLALDRVTLDVPTGQCVALIGESGSGKTTLLRTFNRMIEPDGGAVFVDGRWAREVDAVVLRRRTGYVP